MKWFSLLVLCALVLIFVSAKSAKKDSSKHKTKSPGNNVQPKSPAVKSDMDAFNYLTRFGYNACENPSGSNSSDLTRPSCQSSLDSMLKQFQTNFYLPIAKKLDAATRKAMNTPRCGMSDSPTPSVNGSYLWSANRTLKWKLDRDPFVSGSLKTRKYIQQAFDDWANHTGLTFREVVGQEKADFYLAFVSDNHGDVYPLNGTLSHSFYPWAISNRGLIHFNINKQWSNTYDGTGINVRLAASHAIGHSLGLSHVYDKDAIMNPLYQLIQPKDMLPTKDQSRIRLLYQNKLTSSTLNAISHTTTTKPTATKKAWPQIPLNSKWSQKATTVAGGKECGYKLNELCLPYNLYVDDDETLYIVDMANHRIVEWKSGASSGQVVAGGKRYGNRTDQLNFPKDVIVDKQTDSLIICDTNNDRVVQWPRQGGTSGQTIIKDVSCWGLMMDDEGFLYISDYEECEVRRWRVGETNGTVVAGGNGQGNRLDQLALPTYIFVDRNHSVYVSEWGNHRVMKWAKGAKKGIVVAGGHGKGEALEQLNSPRGVVVDQLGTVYVADAENNRIMRWPQGATQGSIVVGGNDKGNQANQLKNPTGLSFDRSNNLYVADHSNYRVQRFPIEVPPQG